MKGTLDNPGGREYKHVDAITPIYGPMEPTKYQRFRCMGPCLGKKKREVFITLHRETGQNANRNLPFNQFDRSGCGLITPHNVLQSRIEDCPSLLDNMSNLRWRPC